MNIYINPHLTIPANEIAFQFTRSRGPGGQNVNKVSTRVELLFNVVRSTTLKSDDKERLLATYRSRIDGDGYLHVVSQESRSQWRNRGIVMEKFAELLRIALTRKKKRTPTRPSKTSQKSRIEQKKSHAAKKRLRGRVNLSGE